MWTENADASRRPFLIGKTYTMPLFNRKNAQKSQKISARELGVAGEVVFEGFDNEEKRLSTVTIDQFRDMVDKDPTVESLYNIFTLPIIAATYRIDADKDDTGEVQADLVRKNLLEPPHKGGMQLPFSLFLDQLLLSIVDGFQLWEKVYRLQDGYLVLKKLAHRDSVGITLIRDDEGGYGGARQQVSYGDKIVDVTMPAHKTFLFTHNKARSFLYGRSALTSLRSAYLKKRRLEWLDSIGLQADAIKPKLLKRVSDAVIEKTGDDTKVARILSSLARLGERKSVASIPFGYEVQELTANGRDPHQSIERQNSEMARAFLATFTLLGSQGGSNVGSYALSDNLSDMLMISLKAFMTKVEEHVNQFMIADMHDLNFAKPHYSEFHFDDLTSDTVEVITEAFKKLLEKDRISDEMVEGIEEATANRLEIDLEQIKKERKKRADKEAKETAKAAAPVEPKPKDDDDDAPGDRQLSDVSSRDFPGLHEDLGVDTDKLGCIMLDLQTFDVLKHIENGEADLVQATKPEDHAMGAVAESEAHVTLLFGLMQNGNLMKEQVDKVLAGWHCDSVVLSDVTSFAVPADAEAVPIVANIQAWDISGNSLHEAHDRLSLLPHVNTFSKYNPHVTIAYVKNDPDTVQKWVKALNQVIPGMRLSATGLNYGDAPAADDKEDDANSGGKFLSDEGNPWHRPLTEAEKTVRFAEINEKMDSFESSYMDAAEPILSQFVQKIVDDGVAGRNIKDVTIELPAEYIALITNTIRTAYNYAKTGAADEHKVPAPATNAKAIAGMKEMTDFVISMQQDDIRGIIAEERLKHPTQLADGEDATNAVLKAAMLVALAAWVANILRPTASSIVGRAVNNGRDDVFEGVAKDGDLFQYSGLLDQRICSMCRSLDGNVVTPEDYARTRWKPPLHFNCRCIWILIRKMSKDFVMPEVTGIDDEAVSEIERVLTTKKQNLIDDGTLGVGQTKKQLANQLSGIDYTGAKRDFFESSIRNNKFETGAVLDKDGNVIASFVGEKSKVSIPTAAARNATISHNHPSGSSFSIQDLKTASTLNLQEVRAVGAEYTYSMKPGPNGWPSVEDLTAARRQADIDAAATIKRRLQEVKLTNNQMFLEHSHEANRLMAERLEMVYLRERV